MLRSTLVTFFLFIPLVSNADFIVEVDGNLGMGESNYEYDDFFFSDYDYDTDINTSVLSAKIYFGRVDTDTSPYREAGFLSKKSAAKITRDATEFDASDFNENTQITTTTLEGRFVIPNSNIILGAGIIKGKEKYKEDDPYYSENESNDVSGFSLSSGIYINDNSAITLFYDKLDVEDEGFGDAQIKTIHLNFKQVHSLGASNHLAWHLDISKREYDDYFDQAFIGGGFKFYLRQNFGVGASLEIGKDDYGSESGARALFTPEISYDFTENIGIYAQINSEAIEYNSDDTETTRTIQFGLTGRF